MQTIRNIDLMVFFTNENNASFFGFYICDSCRRYVSRNRDTLYLGSLVRRIVVQERMVNFG